MSAIKGNRAILTDLKLFSNGFLECKIEKDILKQFEDGKLVSIDAFYMSRISEYGESVVGKQSYIVDLNPETFSPIDLKMFWDWSPDAVSLREATRNKPLD